ncbi:hypothetical protein OH77DRAFT_1150632 [Trametes cingulata]|nr:hypothetical protein OH77DRAFT_1150632 [Trametes cingulata]
MPSCGYARRSEDPEDHSPTRPGCLPASSYTGSTFGALVSIFLSARMYIVFVKAYYPCINTLRSATRYARCAFPALDVGRAPGEPSPSQRVRSSRGLIDSHVGDSSARCPCSRSVPYSRRRRWVLEHL